MQGRMNERATGHASDCQSAELFAQLMPCLVLAFQIFKCSHHRAVNSTGQYLSWVMSNCCLPRAIISQWKQYYNKQLPISVTNLTKIHSWLKAQFHVDPLGWRSQILYSMLSFTGPGPFFLVVPLSLQHSGSWASGWPTNEERVHEGPPGLTCLPPVSAHHFHSSVNGEYHSCGITFIQEKWKMWFC